MDKKRRPILYKGEVYSKPVLKNTGGSTPEPSITYEEARSKILEDIKQVVSSVNELPSEKRLPQEYIVCLRLQSDYSAKSYYPGSLFEYNVNNEFAEIGSRIWRETNKDNEIENHEQEGKLLFIRTTPAGMTNFENKLQISTTNLTQKFTLDIRKIKSVDLLTPSEQILGISDDWREGRLEAILHPFALSRHLLRDHFISILEKLGVKKENIKIKQYDSGITFVSLFGNRTIANNLANYNPLRMLHPLEARGLPVLRGTSVIGSPLPPDFDSKSSIIVGMFDGGIPEKNPFLKNYVEAYDSVTQRPNDVGIAHGNAVAGVILYGALNKFKNGEKLPEPNVMVKSYRVLPTSNPADIDLYEVIDIIEDVVPKEKEVKVYNLSLGPKGEILDDPVTRFTYALDKLMENYDVLFCTAVGNDGEKSKNRIQSPSDSVNGLGVGAYTKRDGVILKAPYSCIGPGREGNKLKPDLSAFGGCDQTPIHLFSLDPKSKLLSIGGTSFSSPYVSSMAAQLIGRSNGIMNTITARALLIHSAKTDTRKHSFDLGHGTVPDDIEEIVTCVGQSYTLLYQGEIHPGKYAELKIPWMDNSSIRGKVNFHWTLIAMSDVDPSRSDDYTEGALLISFYPNSHKYLYKYKKSKKTATIDTYLYPDKAQALEKDGWIKSSFPKSEVGPPAFMNEDELRKNMKWDTVENKYKNKQSANDVRNPMFHIHALTRGDGDQNKKIKYALVLTVETPNSDVDLYAGVLQNFDALATLQLQSRNEIRVH